MNYQENLDELIKYGFKVTKDDEKYTILKDRFGAKILLDWTQYSYAIFGSKGNPNIRKFCENCVKAKKNF